MEVILIRHGIAEDGVVDAKRELTPKGIERLHETFKDYAKELDTNSMTRVWSSPLVRAVQTAAILCDHLKIEDFERYSFIASGEYELFKEAIDAQDVRSRIIICGHEPILSEWTLQLTGEYHPFKKGMIVSIDISEKPSINYVIKPKK